MNAVRLSLIALALSIGVNLYFLNKNVNEAKELSNEKILLEDKYNSLVGEYNELLEQEYALADGVEYMYTNKPSDLINIRSLFLSNRINLSVEIYEESAAMYLKDREGNLQNVMNFESKFYPNASDVSLVLYNPTQSI